MSIETAADRYLKPLKTCVAGIEASLRDETDLGGAGDPAAQATAP